MSLLFSITTVTDKGLLRRKPRRAHTYQPTSPRTIWQWEFPKDFQEKAFSAVLAERISARESEVLLIDGGDDLFLLQPLGEKSNDRHQNP
jgi:hypothetical protein